MGTLKFFPFQSTIQPGFWNSLANKKLEELKLSESPLDIWGSFTHTNPPKAQLSPRMSIEWDALEDKMSPSWNQTYVRGEVLLMNTIEAFKNLDKSAFIKRSGEKIWRGIVSGEFWADPSVLSSFSVLMFADLKKFQFYYWFAFPAFSLPQNIKLESSRVLATVLSTQELTSLASASVQFSKDHPNSSYSFVSIQNGEVVFQPLSAARQAIGGKETSRNMLCVFDPCSYGEFPGWPVRNLVIAIAATDPRILTDIEILCLRVCSKEGSYDAGHSVLLKLQVDEQKIEEMPGVVGWEKNDKNQLSPRFVNMRTSMDPVKIAESSVDLNLKLMKWRLLPEIDLELLKSTKFLLLGSGTLGCGVARSLLGWGVRNVTFLDNSKVSYSNPVRQSLYEFDDCLNGGQNKAVCAAKKLEKIFPGVKSRGVELSIPMPGHTISEATEEKVRSAHDQLKALIEEHDVIFLLMDSRESRWLPTVMAACYPEKLVINAALGFDTYLVMRHGVRKLNLEQAHPSKGLLYGEQLGCYFCNDVVAPGDSLSDRTLDMQCTVTRPGGSAIAAALAVELAVSCLEHPLRAGAPAPITGSGEAGEPVESVLGIIPHTIRGSLHTFHQFLPSAPAFSQCTACSPTVVQIYKEEGFELVRKVSSNPKYLEDITGLTDLLSNSDIINSVIGLEDDDTFSLTSGSDV